MQFCRLQCGQVFLHWFVANAAGAGLLGLLFDLIEGALSRQGPNYDSAGLLWFIWFALVMLGLVGLLYSQELILRAGGLPAPFWIAASIGGLFLGGIAGAAVALVLGGWAWIVDSEGLVFVVVVLSTFTPGAVLGWVQSMAYSRSWRGHLAWVITQGIVLFPLLACGAICDVLELRYSAITVLTICGGIYGLITGSCLVWLLPKTPEEAERNRLHAAS